MTSILSVAVLDIPLCRATAAVGQQFALSQNRHGGFHPADLSWRNTRPVNLG